MQRAHGKRAKRVVAGTTEDKPEVAARVAWAGAGIDLETSTPTPAQVRAAVLRLLEEPSFRENARRIAADYARHDSVAEAIAVIEGATTMSRKTPADAAEAEGEPERKARISIPQSV